METSPTETWNAPTEIVGFDVKVSSPLLAYSAIRRIYLKCRRPNARTWLYKGRRAAHNNLPDFDLVRGMASKNIFGYTSPSVLGLLR